MANYQLTEDLRIDALFRAGEPQDATSDFFVPSLRYLNRINQILVLGGGVAVGRDLAQSAGIYARLVSPPITDWWWARKRGNLTTLTDVEFTGAGVINGGNLIVLAPAVAPSLVGRRVLFDGEDVSPIVEVHPSGSTVATLDGPFIGTTSGTQAGTFIQLEYDLPQDFLRFVQKPTVHSSWKRSLNVSGLEQRDEEFPILGDFKGIPTRAYYVGPQRVALNAHDDTAYRFEFEYIKMPLELTGDDQPDLPPHHRQVLAVGAAMMIAFDKNDGRSTELASEYRELVSAMHQEHRRMLTGGSSTFASFKVRAPSRRLRSQQDSGTLFFV